MPKGQFLFRRRNYDDLSGNAYYEYRGYYFVNSGDSERVYPVILFFKTDELVIAYKGMNFIEPVFSLYAADGELNQAMLSEKIESYWKMPLWKPLWKEEKKTSRGNLETIFIVDKVSLNFSPFPLLMGFTFRDDHFERLSLFKQQKNGELHIERHKLKFLFPLQGDGRGDERFEEWIFETEEIKTEYINFRRILIDFLFELKHADTFEDKNFLKLRSALQNNKLLDALSRKIDYLYHLWKLQGEEIRRGRLPKPFLKAEKNWLNVCFLETYKEVFTSPETIFQRGVEEEVKNVVFNACIGERKRIRREYFGSDENSVNIRNHAVSFFVRRYAIYDAFKLLLPQWFNPVFLIPIFLLIPFGDYLLFEIVGKKSSLIGIFSVGIPLLLFLIGVFYYLFRRVNLFKLMLPRMFLGITMGWLAFATGEELWKKALLTSGEKLLLANFIFCIATFIYLFTEIRNRLVRMKNRDVFGRTLSITILAMIISLIQGFYVLQLFAKPMLENSGMIDDIVKESNIVNTAGGNKHYSIDCLGLLEAGRKGSSNGIKLSVYTYAEKFQSSFCHYLSLKLFGSDNYHIRYLWSVLLSQFIMAIFIGIILQFLWEDRPITEPL